MKKTGSSLLLLLAALIWGMAFVAQRTGMDHVGPFTFQCARSLLGSASLLPVVLYRRRKEHIAARMPSMKASLVCGAALCLAATLQQVGLQYTTASKAGFITSLYVVVVPLIGLLRGKRPGVTVWVGVVFSAVGLYLISRADSLIPQKGDLLMIGSALFFGVHITAVDHFAPHTDGVALCCAQFFVAGLIALPLALFVEAPSLDVVLAAKWPILYTGILSSGVAFSLQIIGQQRTPPVVASLLMSLESVFSAIAGAIILHEVLSGRELAGCGLMLFAVLLSQLSPRKRDAAA